MRRMVIAISSLLVGGLALAGGPSRADLDTTTPGDLEITADQVLRWAHVDAPEPGEGLQIHLDFPDESPLMLGETAVYALTVDLTPDDGMIVRNAVAGEAARAGDDPAGACNDPTYSRLGVTWAARDLPVKWRWNTRSRPDGITNFATNGSMRRAHKVWPDVHTNCSAARDNSFDFAHRGYTWRHIKRDGMNTIDFGVLGGGALASNYTWYVKSRIVETDMRLNKRNYRWTNRPEGVRAYQVVNVVTHELGHQVGLDDLGWPHGGQTMYGRTHKGERKKITLGRGDIRGARSVSP